MAPAKWVLAFAWLAPWFEVVIWVEKTGKTTKILENLILRIYGKILPHLVCLVFSFPDVVCCCNQRHVRPAIWHRLWLHVVFLKFLEIRFLSETLNDKRANGNCCPSSRASI